MYEVKPNQTIDGRKVRIAGHDYEVVGMTKHARDVFQRAERRIEALLEQGEDTGEREDEVMRERVTQIASRLRPVGDAPDPATLLSGYWDAGELEAEQVVDLLLYIGERSREIAERVRPPA